MDIFNVLSLLGGLAMFLYGMNVMGDGLAKTAGGKLEKILEKQAPQLIQEIIDYYSAPLREMQDEAFDAIQTAEKAS